MTFDATGRWVVVTMLAVVAAMGLSVGAQQGQEGPGAQFERARLLEENSKTLNEAIVLYKQVAAQAGSNRALAARALLRAAECYQKLGDPQARTVFERIVREFADQTDAVALARTRLGTTTTQIAEIGLRKVLDGAIEVAVSPDGRYLAHHNMMLANELHVRDLASGVERILDKGPGLTVLEPKFSKDSRQVAYGTCDDSKPAGCEVRAVDVQPAANAAPRRLYVSDAFVGPMDWSPDGKSIAVYVQRRADRVLQLAILNVTSGTLRVLQSVAWGGTIRAFFSPDGGGLAFTTRVEEDNGASDIFLMNLQENRQTALVTSPGNDVPLGWTPDGTHLLFSSNRNGGEGVWAQRVADGKPQGSPTLIKGNVGGSVWPAGVTRSGALYMGVRTSSEDIEVRSVDLGAGKQVGAPVRPIRSVADRKSGPRWSADGRLLAYLGARDGEIIIGVREMDTGAERQLRLGSALDRVPKGLTWTPDGRSFVVFGRDLKGRYGVFRIGASDGTVTPMFFRDPPNLDGFSWSPDGRKMYYRQGVISTIYEREGDIERVLLPGNETARTTWTETNVPEHWNGPIAASPDGRWLALFRTGNEANAGALIVLPLAGGEPRELLQVRVSKIDQAQLTDIVPMWTPDGRSLLVENTRGSDPSEFLLVPVDGTAPRKLDIDVKSIATRLSPDGRQLAYVVGEDRVEVWVMENFLPTLKARR